MIILVELLDDEGCDWSHGLKGYGFNISFGCILQRNRGDRVATK